MVWEVGRMPITTIEKKTEKKLSASILWEGWSKLSADLNLAGTLDNDGSTSAENDVTDSSYD